MRGSTEHRSKSLGLIVVLIVLGILIPYVLTVRWSSEPVQPVLSLISVGTGTLTTDLKQIKFTDRFSVHDRAIVAVVAFSQISEGTNVHATWFSPDDRSPPVGRKSVVSAKDGSIIRFSIASDRPWKPSIYMLRIDAEAPASDGTALSATGNTQFFIGMSDEEVRSYRASYALWKEQSRSR